MSPTELFPVVGGLLVGVALGLVTPLHRKIAGIILAFVTAVVATVISGEYRISWSFLLVDIPVVCGAAYAGFFCMQRIRYLRS